MAAYLNARDYGSTDWEAMRRLIRLRIALDTGWTLEYIDEMMLQDYEDILALWQGEADAREMNRG